METNLIKKFKYLPDVLVHKIINYTDIVVYRNGKYIDRFNKLDKRYFLIDRIPRPIKVGQNKVILRLMNGNYDYMSGYLLEYNFKDNYIKLHIKFVVRELDGFDRYYNIISDNTYIFNINNRWVRLINYSV